MVAGPGFVGGEEGEGAGVCGAPFQFRVAVTFHRQVC